MDGNRIECVRDFGELQGRRQAGDVRYVLPASRLLLADHNLIDAGTFSFVSMRDEVCRSNVKRNVLDKSVLKYFHDSKQYLRDTSFPRG